MEQLFRPASAPTDRLVLYFNGWALSPIAVEHLGLPEGQDLLLLWDYRTDALDFDFSPYREIRLVAWSMGIWAADRFFAKHEELRSRVVSGTALAGTGYQVDDAVGIPEAFFQKTLEGLTEENRERFDRHMLGGKTYRHLYEEVRQRSTKALYDEFVRPFTVDRDQPRPLPKPAAFGLWSKARRTKRTTGASRAYRSRTSRRRRTTSSATSAAGRSSGSSTSFPKNGMSRPLHCWQRAAHCLSCLSY